MGSKQRLETDEDSSMEGFFLTEKKNGRSIVLGKAPSWLTAVDMMIVFDTVQFN